MIYQILVLVFGLIPVNKDFKHAKDGIEIYVGTNGVHTDIVMPVHNEWIDWRKIVPLSHYPAVDDTFKFISLGWGDKGFYINTPTWSDLTISTAFRALFIPSPTAMHVTYIRNSPLESVDYVKVYLSHTQYQKLIGFIRPYFQIDGSNVILIPEAGYGFNDNFYEAYTSYHMFNTSNNWTNKALKKTGVRTPLWSPLDRPIMNQLKKIR